MALTFDNSAPKARSMPSRRFWPAATSSCVPARRRGGSAVPDLRAARSAPALNRTLPWPCHHRGRHHAIAGTINNFRLTNAGGTAIISGSVGTSGADLNVTNNVIPSGAIGVLPQWRR